VRVIVGLGNPGREYQGSRHNVGFLAVTELARAHRIGLAVASGDLVSGTGRVAGERVILALPQSYMNDSGGPVARILDATGAVASDLLVVSDDIDLPLGQLRLRLAGRDGGHRGLRSIAQALGTTEFPRLRLGVGAPSGGEGAENHVLGAFDDSEWTTVLDMVSRAVECMAVALTRGLSVAMSIYNRREAAVQDDEAEEAR